MSSSVIYDDAGYHSGAPSFSTSKLDPKNAGTHIGMYLAWIIQRRLESFSLRQRAAAAVEQVRCKEITGREFLFAHCEGRLTSEALNKEAQAFTAFYYEPHYLKDYHEILVTKASGTYTVGNTWANCDRMAALMDQRLGDYRGLAPLAAS